MRLNATILRVQAGMFLMAQICSFMEICLDQLYNSLKKLTCVIREQQNYN